MNTDLPVFDRRNLKRYFYYFIATILVMTMIGIPFKGALTNISALSKVNTWIIFAIIFAPSLVYSNWSKKEIKKIIAIPEVHKQIGRYETFYKRRMIWNTISFGTATAFLLLSNGRIFLYVILFQLLLSFAFYPTKKLVTRELKNPDIILL